MTFREIINAVDEYKPNALPEMQKFLYLAELEGRIAADVMLLDIIAIRERERKYPRDLDAEPLVTYPHQGLLRLWLETMIDKDHGEYSKYQNTIALFNAAYENFVNWFTRTYRPAQGYGGTECIGCNRVPPYYVAEDIYTLALDMGYGGSRMDFARELLELVQKEEEK